MASQLRRAAVAGIALAALVTTGCTAGAGDSGSGGGAQADTLTVGVTGEPANLDFTTTSGSAIPQVLMNNVYQGLVRADQDGEIVPQLAEEWTVSEDGTVYDFTLREGVTFSNGGEFTADDVKFSLERIATEWTTANIRMDVLDHVEVIDDHHARVVLKRASNQWLLDMTGTVGQMFDEEGVDDLANTAVGTGPYEVVERVQGDRITLEARDDYWGEAPAMETVTFRYFADAVASTNALQSGDVDLLYNMQAPDLVPQFEGDDQYQVLQGTSTGEILLALNNAEAPFDDVRVRQAIAYALDEQAILDTAWAGYGELIGAFVPPTEPFYEDLTDEYPHDPERARQLLAEAGVENLTIDFDVPTRPYANAVAEVVISQLADVGITANIVSDEFPAVWLDKVFTRGDYQMSVILATEAHDFLTAFNNPEYYLHYDNSKIAPLVEAADAAPFEEYVDGMKEVVRIVTEDAASIPLFLFPNIIIADAGLTGIPANAVTESFDVTGIAWQ